MEKKFICPWWMGYMLANPLRKLVQNPESILSLYINEGTRILEVGPGMGFFTLPMAKMAGKNGKVYAIDVQERMLSTLKKKAAKSGLSDIVETRVCGGESLGVKDLAGSIDFALLFAVVHEVPDESQLLLEINETLKPGAKLLISEPSGHVTKKRFLVTVKAAESSGFSIAGEPVIRGGYSVLLQK